MDGLEAAQRQLSALPAELEELASAAAARAAALQAAGGFSLQGLAAADSQGGRQPQGEAGAGPTRRATATVLGGGLIPARACPSTDERRAFAKEVLARLGARLEGRLEGRADAVARSEEECVDALVAAATSVDNLARMWEGWAAWV